MRSLMSNYAESINYSLTLTGICEQCSVGDEVSFHM